MTPVRRSRQLDLRPPPPSSALQLSASPGVDQSPTRAACERFGQNVVRMQRPSVVRRAGMQSKSRELSSAARIRRSLLAPPPARPRDPRRSPRSPPPRDVRVIRPAAPWRVRERRWHAGRMSMPTRTPSRSRGRSARRRCHRARARRPAERGDAILTEVVRKPGRRR